MSIVLLIKLLSVWASPEMILELSKGEIKNQKPLTTAHINLKWTVCSAKAFWTCKRLGMSLW
jgi:hypothetical protein